MCIRDRTCNTWLLHDGKTRYIISSWDLRHAFFLVTVTCFEDYIMEEWGNDRIDTLFLYCWSRPMTISPSPVTYLSAKGWDPQKRNHCLRNWTMGTSCAIEYLIGTDFFKNETEKLLFHLRPKRSSASSAVKSILIGLILFHSRPVRHTIRVFYIAYN